MSCIIMLEVALLLFLFLQFSNLEIVRSAQRFQAPAKGKIKALFLFQVNGNSYRTNKIPRHVASFIVATCNSLIAPF